jgi:hypothetical protein
MKKNLGKCDRTIRLIIAVIIVGLLVAYRHTGIAAIVLVAIALIVLLTGTMGFCPLYAPFNLSTRKKG